MRSLESYLAGKREAVERSLDHLLPPAGTPPESLHEAMRYSVFSGGKRLRPILAIAAYELAGGEGDAVMAPACATEIVHTYSLIHDDLPAMDDDDVRRGRPTCHKVYGEGTAILAGDGLLTLAFDVVAREEALAPERRIAIARELARANGPSGMVGGQVADMEGEGAEPTLEGVTFIHRRKTALPLEAAVVIGGLAAGATDEALAAFRAYGGAVGLSFQIADDLLDERGTAEEMGKAVGKDRGKGKLTYPGVVGVDAAEARARELVDEALAALAPFGDEAWPLREIARFIVDRRN